MTPPSVNGLLQVKVKFVKIIIILAISNQTISQSAIGRQINSPAPTLMLLVEPLLICQAGQMLKQSDVLID